MARSPRMLRLPGRRKPVEITTYVDRSELLLKDPDRYFAEARKRARSQLKAERRGQLAAG